MGARRARRAEQADAISMTFIASFTSK